MKLFIMVFVFIMGCGEPYKESVPSEETLNNLVRCNFNLSNLRYELEVCYEEKELSGSKGRKKENCSCCPSEEESKKGRAREHSEKAACESEDDSDEETET